MKAPSENQTSGSPEHRHYTPQGQHPEDRIYADKQYINRLQEHMQHVFRRLTQDLRINKEGEEMLFDFVFNEEKPMEFSDLLAQAGISYASLIKSNTE
jgi:hypothetical protein